MKISDELKARMIELARSAKYEGDAVADIEKFIAWIESPPIAYAVCPVCKTPMHNVYNQHQTDPNIEPGEEIIGCVCSVCRKFYAMDEAWGH